MGIWVRGGTVSIANGARVVTGNLTVFGVYVQPGNPITFDGGKQWYEVEALDAATPNTKLTLATDFQEASIVNGQYAIIPFLGDRSPLAVQSLSSMNNVIAAQTDVIETSGAPNPAISPGNIGNKSLAFDKAARAYYHKVDGVWTGPIPLGGDAGWSPILAVVTDSARRVLQIVDWTGGQGTKPATDGFIGATGIVGTAALAVDVRGATGAASTVPGPSLNPRGNYAAGTAYAKYDVVLNQNSSWVLIVATSTGNAPPTLPTTSNTQWQLLAQKGTDGAGAGDVVGPAASVANRLAVFSSTTGKAIADGGAILSTDGTLANNLDSRVPTEKAVKTYVDGSFAKLRPTLAANVTYYVRTDGVDTNNGLANTAGGAFKTIQKAVDAVAAVDANGFTVAIQIGDGTYTGAVKLKNVVGFSAAGSLIIRGNNSTPANVVISVTGDNCFTASGLNVVWDILDLKMQTTTGGDCLNASAGGTIRYGNVNFGACAGSHVASIQRGSIIALSSYAISGGASAHFSSTYFSYLNAQGLTITISGTPAFSFAFATAQMNALLAAATITFSGSATGNRFYVSNNATIFTNGGGASYLPGSAAGTGTNPSASPYGLFA